MSISTTVTALFASFLYRHLPDRTKRLMFLASLSARLSKKTTFDQRTLHKLNQAMSLSADDSALNLPVQISHAIWKGDNGVEILRPNENFAEMTSEKAEELIDGLISAAPKWIHYGKDDKELRSDVRELLMNQELLAAVRAG
jgi:hypothetical protein